MDFHSIVHAAIRAGASDIHLQPKSPVIFRIHRDLVAVDTPPLTEADMASLLESLVPAHLRDTLERDREIDFAADLPGLGRLRINLFQQRGQMSLAIRIVKTTVRSLEELRLPPILGAIAQSARGIVVVAGNIGSGKSTTLAALIEHINCTRREHIITLEDPIEYLFEDKLSVIKQREVGIDTRDFSTGLRNILRQDPDVLVIGEIRDAESASAAMSAANTGHLVLTTLHTADAVRSIHRMLEFFPSAERDAARRLLASTLRAVVCQRLIPAEPGELLPAVEILINAPAISKLIAAEQLDKIFATMELKASEGMQSFDLALQQLVLSGKITQEQALAYAGNPEGLRMIFQGVVHSESRGILGTRG
jgi:twitching motility protein PilT